MYQVTFSDSSAAFFQKLPQPRQLEIIESLSALSPAAIEQSQEPLGRFNRADTTYYRYRLDDLRFYFTLKQETLHCVYILNKNTWADFRLRSNLEKLSDSEIESKPHFWDFLEGN